jgi:CrcB protein
LAGVFARYLVNSLVASGASTFPVGTLAVNLLGSFLIGFVSIACAENVSEDLRVAITAGFLGGFTTFSAFSLDAVTLFSSGQAATGSLYLAASVGGGIAATAFGLLAARALFM